MMLADMGAEVIVLERPPREGALTAENETPLRRGRRSVIVDLKQADGVDVLLRLADRADALIEGFRPGVMERLGAGPEVCLKRNPRLVYGRMTGWGQDGAVSGEAGHDINYLALCGTLGLIGRAGEPPLAPLNLVGDFGGGGMLLAFGVLCALFEAQRSGRGQVVDAAMIDGAALLAASIHGMLAAGRWSTDRGTNMLDGGAPFYEVYECADGEYVAVGALEPQFYQQLVERLGLPAEDLRRQWDARAWPEMKERFAAMFRTKTRDEWAAIMSGAEACVTPVLSPDEAARHPHNSERQLFLDLGGVRQPAPAPRLSRTPAGEPEPPPEPGAHTEAVLAAAGFSPGEIDSLHYRGAIQLLSAR
jgi:alpha-methylacyl-CoA racemase